MSEYQTHQLPANRWTFVFLALFVPLTFCASSVPVVQQGNSDIDEINTEFHFMGPDDTILIHEEEGRLKGQIDAYQNDEESDTVLSFVFTIGTRKNNHVEFKTAKIHQKYYRFSGEVARGSGHEEKDEDYLRLAGNLQIITVNPDNGQETVEEKQVVFKSLSAEDMADD
jgi:hypothetical protein